GGRGLRLLDPAAPLRLQCEAGNVEPVERGGGHECGLSNAGIKRTSTAASVAAVSTDTGNSYADRDGSSGCVNRACFIIPNDMGRPMMRNGSLSGLWCASACFPA